MDYNKLTLKELLFLEGMNKRSLERKGLPDNEYKALASNLADILILIERKKEEKDV